MPPATLSLVVAYARQTRVIGLNSSLPWPRLPTDLARFAALTARSAIIMGRRTFESAEVGGVPLKGRRNVVLSRHAGWLSPAGVVHAADWREALLLAEAGFGGAGYDDGERVTSAAACERRSIFVVGGEMVYRLALAGTPACRTVFATEIEDAFKGDTFFPELPSNEWLRIGGESAGDDGYDAVPAEQCPKGWASPEPVTENGITYRFVTYQRRTAPHP